MQELDWLCAQVIPEADRLSDVGVANYFRELFRNQSESAVKVSQSAPSLGATSLTSSQTGDESHSSSQSCRLGTRISDPSSSNMSSSLPEGSPDGNNDTRSLASSSSPSISSSFPASLAAASPASTEAGPSDPTEKPQSDPNEKPKSDPTEKPQSDPAKSRKKSVMSSMLLLGRPKKKTAAGANRHKDQKQSKRKKKAQPATMDRDFFSGPTSSVSSLSSLTPGQSRELRRQRSSSETSLSSAQRYSGSAARIHKAVKSGKVDLLRVIAKQGIPLSGPTARDSYGNTPLSIAVKEGLRAVINFLILCEVDLNEVDNRGWSALHWAALNADLETCRLLLSEGCDILETTETNNTPLHYLAKNDQIGQEDPYLYLQVFLLMQQRRPDICRHCNAQGETPLHLACMRGSKQSALFFLEFANVDLNAQTKRGETALSYAIRFNKASLVSTMLEQGASLDVDVGGQTVLEIAREHQLDHIVELLEEYSSQEDEGATLIEDRVPQSATRTVRSTEDVASSAPSSSSASSSTSASSATSDTATSSSSLTLAHPEENSADQQALSPRSATSNGARRSQRSTQYQWTTSGSSAGAGASLVSKIVIGRKVGQSTSSNAEPTLLSPRSFLPVIGLDPQATILSSCTAMLERPKLQHWGGSLFVLPESVTFLSLRKASAHRHRQRIQIFFKDIRSVDKCCSNLVVPDSIQITTRTRNFLFRHIRDRDSVYSCILESWRTFLRKDKPDPSASIGSPQKLPPKLEKQKFSGLESKPSRCNSLEDSSDESVVRDCFGFLVKPLHVPAYQQYQAKAVKSIQSRNKKWDSFLEENGDFYTFRRHVEMNSNELLSLLALGIPSEYRSGVWLRMSGAEEKKMDSLPNYYRDLLSEPIEHSSRVQIEKDLGRTFPDHPIFESEDGRARLRNILFAYSNRNPQLGYCQAMNFLAGILVLIFQNEEDAFWVFTVIVENHLPDYFHRSLIGTMVDQGAFDELLRQVLPKLQSKFDEISFPVSCVTMKWFMGAFVHSGLPTDTLIALWDLFIFHGADILFDISLAIFSLTEKELLRVRDSMDASFCLTSFVQGLHDPHMLVRQAIQMRSRRSCIDLTNLRLKLCKTFEKEHRKSNRDWAEARQKDTVSRRSLAQDS
eukprot:CAMPEP_0177688730 /NCGR_PEP_ID=MMETSP0447-20121125/34805_1 /TAXON_ID=0 /ORGANISM="Stygamoeba regulata, Strain BSH-02190019" /LENGTH=1131 /DNA_ID=CAMNT_0019199033 /DNA_START=238 /DNA_END=3633 /DNA_ORIENTATION=+